MELQYFLSIDGLITGIVAFVFGLVVLTRNKRNIINQTLFLLTTATALWALGYWQWLSVYDNRELALFWVRILSIGSILIPLFYFHWIISLLGLNKQNKKKIIAFYIIVFCFLFFSFSSIFVREVEPAFSFSFWPKAGWLYSLYLILIYFSLVIYSVFLLFKYYRNSVGLKRAQIKYVLWGSILGFGGGATNFFLWYNIPILPFGNFLVILYPILFSYSIITHRLMDIKFVLRKSSVYLASFSTIIVVALGVKYILTRYFFDIALQADFVILILGILAFTPVKNYFYRLANKYFFSSLYDGQKVIAEISDKLKSTLEVKNIYGFIYETVNNTFHTKSFAVLSYNEKTGYYIVQYNKGFDIGRQKKFLSNKYLHDMFIGRNKSIVVEEIKNTPHKKSAKKTIELFSELKVEVLTPLNIKDKTVGLLILGRKESGDMYNDEDLQVLEIIGAQAAISMENALLYEETLSFNIKLKKEIEKATRDLRKANEELKKLDVAKSEFISIASHQLRTPLTVIKGYISMILEGNFGAINEGAKSSLKKVYESGERLIQLIENLLNVSRIESGRLQFTYEEASLEEMAESVIEELSNAATRKGLKLNYKKLAKPLPKIIIDDEKIRQVVMNLIDNAIKYTKKGSITVKLEQVDDEIKFCVSDSGMGIVPEDINNLFQKFTRGRGTSVVHTEGTGLGLYVARQMVETHQGKIWAESKGEGRGAKFCFKLPLKLNPKSKITNPCLPPACRLPAGRQGRQGRQEY